MTVANKLVRLVCRADTLSLQQCLAAWCGLGLLFLLVLSDGVDSFALASAGGSCRAAH